MISESEAGRTIEEIKFGILSPDEIRKLSTVEIKVPDTYDEDGAPIESGLMDPRLGTLEPKQVCRTCGNTAVKCFGHFGKIELASEVIHVGFAKMIHSLLSVTCRNCGRILLEDGEIEKLKHKLEELKKLLGTIPERVYDRIIDDIKKVSRCPRCGERQHKIDFQKPVSFYEISKEGAQKLTPSIIRKRLERIPDEDLALLGIDPKTSRPEWAVLQVLPVPPLSVRPSITLESGMRSEDDLTHKLVDIIRINQRLKENLEAGAPPLIIQNLQELLRYHVTTYFDNEAPNIPPARHRSGKILRTLSQRLKGKEGRFRGNLSGKRVDYSTRAVISPDPSLDINEVGVPLYVAERLTVPMKVTEANLKEAIELVKRGPESYPGAVYVIRPDGRKIRLEYAPNRDELAESLKPGFIIERHIRDGDVVIFNRQPSLHRMSIMSHYVKVMPGKTLRLHPSVCPPYNADFDGDEMNLHVPQSEEARVEAELLAKVQQQILSPRYGGPIIGAIRDFITAAFLLTRKTTTLTKQEVCDLLGKINYKGPLPEPAIKEPIPQWTGKQIFSLFLPKGFNHTQKASICQECEECLKENCPYDAYVVIENGILKKGVIDKNSIGAEKPNSILHRIAKEYGFDRAAKFLNDLCRLLNTYISRAGFTYGYDEFELPEDLQGKIEEIILNAKKRVSEIIEEYERGTLKKLPGQTLEDSKELYIIDELSKARDAAGALVDEYFGLDTSGVIMTKTGARGSSLNIAQMTTCLGQQSIRGKRITRGYEKRPLPHFKWGDSSAEACGFVKNSYYSGLNPIEFFFHAMAGREGLVDTAVRTQQSGYLQRRLINALEHLKVAYDGTLRDSEGNIIQFKYGEDGVDPAKSDHGKAVNIRALIEQEVEEGEPASPDYVKEEVKKAGPYLNEKISNELMEELLKSKVSKKVVDRVIRRAIEEYEKSQIEPGEAIGIISAQSIGEPGTQMTLRTFHYAGVRELNVTLGLPRIIEIVSARKTPSTPVMTIYLDEDHRYDMKKAEEVAQSLPYTTVSDVANVEISPEGDIILKLDEHEARNRGVTIELLRDKLKTRGFNPALKGNEIWIRARGEINPVELARKISQVYIKGIPGIQKVIVEKEEGEWVLRSDGSNLGEVLKVKGVDVERTITNDIHEIAKTLGIEAARNAIIEEICSVLEEQGLDVDIRHVMLIADIMTFTGEIRSIGRHGVCGEKPGVLARAAFEVSTPTLINAAIRGSTDHLAGVVENIIVGQTTPIGTGMVDLLMKVGTEGEA